MTVETQQPHDKGRTRVRSATDFTGIRPGVLKTDMINPDELYTLMDSADSDRKDAVNAFQNEMPDKIISSIAKWIAGRRKINECNDADHTMKKINDYLKEVMFTDDIIDVIVEQLDSDPSIFMSDHEQYRFVGVCIGMYLGDSSMQYDERKYMSHCGDDFDVIEGFDPSIEGMVCTLDVCKEHITENSRAVSDNRLEITIIPDFGDNVDELGIPLGAVGPSTMYITCSPFITHAVHSGDVPVGCCDLTCPMKNGHLCYTLPPWLFNNTPMRETMVSNVRFTTEVSGLALLHNRYIEYIALKNNAAV